jgi:Flp pilus assembly protein TadG
MDRTGGLQGRRAIGDDGAAVVEMSLVGIILVLLLMGIMAFGYLMSFRQNMVQAATEGARAGAVAAAGNAPVDARLAAEQAVAGFGKDCGSNGLRCDVTVGQCPNAPLVSCVTVHLEYDYENHPLLPDIPVIGGALPDTIEASAVAEVNT